MSLNSFSRTRRYGLGAAVSALLAAALIAGCGGGGSGGVAGSSSSAALSSGAITAFGSVFVNGHEFGTSRATVIDDDTGATSSTSSLEVGMVVAVKPTSESTDRSPEAAEIHVSPLARGFVDASATNSITVMGQAVQLTSATVFTDHRACVTAATPCAAIAGQAGLTATSGSTPGTFVAVHGYLLGGSSGAQIVATLVSALDYNAQGSNPSMFKVEGQVGAPAAGAPTPSVTIGTEVVDLSKATCHSGGATVDCATAFKQGDIVAARGVTAPVGVTFTADAARLARLLPQTVGATVEIEGKVSSVNGKTFVVRGIQVDGTALSSDQFPAVGDKVEVMGTINADGTVTATGMEHDEHAGAAHVVLAGPLGTVVASTTTTGTFDVTVLGQTVNVSAQTHIADRTTMTPTTFNITNFDTYLNGKSVFVVVRTVADSTGTLHATGFDIVPAPKGGFVAVAGKVDAAPVSSTGGMSTLTVHGVSVTFDPAKATVVQGSFVIAKGTLTTAGAIDTTVSNGRLVVLDGHGDDCEVDFGN